MSKGELVDAIIQIVATSPAEEQDRATAAFLHAAAQRSPLLLRDLNAALAPVGWGLTETGEPYPRGLHVAPDAQALPDHIRDTITLSLCRFRDGDYSGAITAICGAVDLLTAQVYLTSSLGDHGSASYQERVSKSFHALEGPYKQVLDTAGMDPDEIKRVYENHRSAVNGAGYVLGSFRRNFSDVHGARGAPRVHVQAALDCAIFILRSISALP